MRTAESYNNVPCDVMIVADIMEISLPSLRLKLLALPAAGQRPYLPVRVSNGDELVPLDNILVDTLGAIHVLTAAAALIPNR